MRYLSLNLIVADGRSGANRNASAAAWRTSQYCSRWEIGGYRNLQCTLHSNIYIVADGRSGANRNFGSRGPAWESIVADGKSGANRNILAPVMASSAL